MLIRAYRVRGHLLADLDPLGLAGNKHHPELDPQTYGFTEADLDREFFLDNVLGLEKATLRRILEILRQTYSAKIGVEFMHIQDPDQKAWIQARMEGSHNLLRPSAEEKRELLEQLVQAEGFERFLHVKYPGTKRFGLDGGESAIPALEAIIRTLGELGVDEIVIGMPHRGRLNVLANIMGKPYPAIFSEFQGGAVTDDVLGSGDVKYHLGTSTDRELPDGGTVHLSLTANPSHLEAVNPVVLGKVRAKQTQKRDTERARVMGLLLTATPRSPARAWCTRGSRCRSCAASAPAARSTSSSTTRSASPPARPMRAPRPIRPTSRAASRRRSSTSTATIPRRWCTWRGSPPSSASASRRTW